MWSKLIKPLMLLGLVSVLGIGFLWLKGDEGRAAASDGSNEVSTASVEASSLGKYMGALPSDVCLGKDGRPYLIQASGNGYAIYPGVSLTYVSQSGDLVVVQSLMDGFGGWKTMTYRWSGYGCPTQ